MENPDPVTLLRKVPPQNLEAEQSTLGSMMLEKYALEKGLETLEIGDFYRPVHQEVFDALQALYRQNEVVDLITLQEELRKRGKLEEVGGTEYLMALVDSVPTAANIEYYAKIVEQKSTLRKMINAGTRLIAMAQNENDGIDDVLVQAEELVFDLTQKRSGIEIIQMRSAYDQMFANLQSMSERYWVPIGLTPLAQSCIGMMPGELIIVGARPQVGKSALAYDLLAEAAKKGYPSAIISLEMTAQQFAMREAAKNSGVNVRQMLTGSITDIHYTKIANAISKVWELPVYYVDAAGWSMAKIHSACRRLVSSMGVKVIAIDHLQIVEPDNNRASRVHQLGQISKDCKVMAKNLKIPVLALCQLTRDVDKRGASGRPALADLKESGDIEANADVVWLLWRQMDNKDMPAPVTEAEIIVAKNRMLQTGVVKCAYHGRLFKFVSRSEMSEPGQKPKESGQKALTGA